MSHARQTIRNAVAAILSVNPVAWKAVTETRIPSGRQIWPYLMVFAESDQLAAATVNTPCVYGRELLLHVGGMLRLPGTGDTYTIEDRMDAVAAEIETKFTQSTMRAALSQIQSVELTRTTMEVVIEEDGIDHAEVILSFKISYSTLEGLPESLL